MMKIEWNSQKCNSPRECRKCLEACSEGVFTTYPREPRAPGKPAGNWAITPTFLSLCTGCGICQEVCPQNAIIVSR